ncbi:DUF58 domain-containing protein [Uliginosibacterium sp. 31-12]|uniref:DUF58 domain-containing protein n=1 Tax=Uliginosibacterium sp. 31-12 TaxID=3062781 RepID=UPI0026E1B91B|nr:DUF58 domain-containing protein [Uliginosibacterium sp. 31-12]MDO6385952.1 DUF58 domain-containing protein [Uliginosibacterium sp. 31-12]
MSAATLRQRFRRWATRTRTPETQPIQLPQRRVYVLPTRAGLALLATLLAMLLASINYNLSLGYGLVFLLGSVFIVHILHSWRTLTGLQLSLSPSGEAFAGGMAQWRVELVNEASHERPAVRLRDSQGRELMLTDVPAGQHSEAFIALPCPQRGVLQPGQLSVESTQPLGWIRAWSYIEPDAPAVIYPAPDGERPLPEGWGDNGEGRSRERPGQDDFAGLRGFQPGDSPRQIAWKQLAQGRGLLTKQFASAGSPACVLDWNMLPATLPLEERLSQLARWVLQTRHSGARTTLLLPDSQTGPGEDAAHHQACLLRLALFGLERSR